MDYKVGTILVATESLGDLWTKGLEYKVNKVTPDDDYQPVRITTDNGDREFWPTHPQKRFVVKTADPIGHDATKHNAIQRFFIVLYHRWRRDIELSLVDSKGNWTNVWAEAIYTDDDGILYADVAGQEELLPIGKIFTNPRLDVLATGA